MAAMQARLPGAPGLSLSLGRLALPPGTRRPVTPWSRDSVTERTRIEAARCRATNGVTGVFCFTASGEISALVSISCIIIKVEIILIIIT